jgi:AcrR family transcriptional regulator
MEPCTRVYTYSGDKSTSVYMTERQRLPGDQPRRPRNAAVTREAILQSAVAAFSRHGYDGIGVREIAQAAGVTAVLVNRYFGSKEELFAAAVETAFAGRGSFIEGDPGMLAERVTADLMCKTEKDVERINVFFLLLRSAPNPRAAQIMRDSIARHFERPLKSLLRGPRAGERAAMILALVSGLTLFREVLGSKALADANAAILAGDIQSMLRRLIDGVASRESPVRRSYARKRNQQPL